MPSRQLPPLLFFLAALRTGPIGYDLDGREYWHLREYQDRMPRFTEGRYSWCLIVLGPPFPAAPAKPAETDPASAVDMGAKPDETAVTKVTHASSDANATTGFSKPASLTIEKEPTPSSKRQGKPSKEIFIDIPFSSSYKKALHNPSSPSPSTTKAKAETGRATAKANDGSVCMGTNDPVVIASLIAYVRYRCDQINYLEDKELLHRQHAADGATEEVEVREEQARRKDQVMRLCKRLHAAREYFAWHREEVIL
nr:hypothetical protein [Thecaphora frezii]